MGLPLWHSCFKPENSHVFKKFIPASDCDIKRNPEYYTLSFFWVCFKEFISKSRISKGKIRKQTSFYSEI